VLERAVGHSGGMTIRCLVVDDDADFLTAARLMLERDGVEVDTATSGAEALERAEVTRPDIALIDVRLGFEDSFDLAERLMARTRADPSDGRRLTVTFVSDYAEEDVAERVARSPATGFLDKSTLSGYLSEQMIRELIASRPDSALTKITAVGAYGSRGR
jgi:CheY-like chemotaxis protein